MSHVGQKICDLGTPELVLMRFESSKPVSDTGEIVDTDELSIKGKKEAVAAGQSDLGETD